MTQQKYQVLLTFLLLIVKCVNQMPINVPVDNNYNDVYERLPNAHYNRLPGNRYSVQTDPIASNGNYDNTQADDYEDYEDTTTTRRPNYLAQYSSSNYNSNNNYSPILTENVIKKKRRRRKRIRRPCIPVQSFNSPLFSNNRYKREIEGADSGKTLGLLFGNRYPYYGIPYYGGYPSGGGGGIGPNSPSRPFYDNVKPQYDSPLYNPVGGYPCIPVSYGHVPLSGPFGFFGPGGLFDSGSSPSFNIPQTVVINRPPLFGNRPGNRPPYYGGGDQADGVNEGTPGFWGTVTDKLSEFVTSVSPQAVYTAIGDTLQGIGSAIQNAQPATAAIDTIRNGYREFASLVFR